jgi:hypothetical protein
MASAALLVWPLGCREQRWHDPPVSDEPQLEGIVIRSAPSLANAVNASLAGKVTYLGLAVESLPILAGRDVSLTHYWRVEAPPGPGWRVFAHASGPGGADAMVIPDGNGGRGYPASRWKSGAIVRDEQTLRLPPTWRHDVVEIHTGLFRGEERMEVRSGAQDGDGRVLGGRFPVRADSDALSRVQRYVVHEAGGPITVDGDLGDGAWQVAPLTEAFADALTGAKVPESTTAQVLWKEGVLFFALRINDRDVRSSTTERDAASWQDDAVALMIVSPEKDSGYLEIYVTAQGTVRDAWLPAYRMYEGPKKRRALDWTSGLRVGVRVTGSIDEGGDVDTGWTLELALPLAGVRAPKVGEVWRLNLFRFDRSGGRRSVSAWSPPLVADVHALDKCKEIVFSRTAP